MTVTQTRNEAGFCPCTVCGKQSLDWWPYPGDTCSQECARTHVIVEVGRELLVLLRAMATPVYYIDKLPLVSREQVEDIIEGRKQAPHPADQEPSSPVPKPSWWDKADY